MNNTIKRSLITTLFLSTTLIAEEKLEDITVSTATKTSQSINDVTSNINVITAQEIEERHYTTVTEALNSLPGVSFTSAGGLGQATLVKLRGMKSSRLLVLIDGIRYNDITSLNGAAFDHILVNDIERIEVVKGAQSGIWGTDASAGVINIITKEAKNGLHFGVSQEFGSFTSTKSSANISYKDDAFYLKASHTNLDTKGFSAVAPITSDLDTLEDDGYSSQSTNLQAGFQINATNKIDFTHIINDSSTQADAFDNTTFNFNPNSQYDSTSKTKLSSVNFNHVDSFNEVNVFAKKTTSSRYYPQDTFTKNFDGETKEYGLSSTIPYLSNSFLLVGADYKKFEHKNSINNSYSNKAFFLTNNNTFQTSMGKTIVTQSLRQDNYNTFDDKTTGKIGLKHNFNIEGLSASTNYGTAYNVPTLYNLYTPFIGNDNLNPESTKAFDISVAYKDFQATYFNTKIDNFIDYDTTISKYGNLSGTSKIKGYELAYNTTLGSDIASNISYTKLKTQNSQGQDLGRQADQTIKVGLDYYGVEDLHLGLNGEYVGERYDQTNKQGQQTGKYVVANFTANYEVDKYMSVYAKVDNITDKEYQTVYGYASSPRAVYVGMKLTY